MFLWLNTPEPNKLFSNIKCSSFEFKLERVNKVCANIMGIVFLKLLKLYKYA